MFRAIFHPIKGILYLTTNADNVLTLNLLVSNLNMLTQCAEGNQGQNEVAQLVGRSSGELVEPILRNRLYGKIPLEEALQKTHAAYHYWQHQIQQDNLRPLQIYFRKGCEGDPIDVLKSVSEENRKVVHINQNAILAHFERLTLFCNSARRFFARVTQSQSLRAVFNTYFCLGCVEDVLLMEAYFHVLALQKSLGTPLPYFSLSLVIEKNAGAISLDEFLKGLQRRKVKARVVHNGLKGFVEIRQLLLKQPPVSVSLLELMLQRRQVELWDLGQIPRSDRKLLMDSDEVQLRWRNGLREDSEVILKDFIEREEEFFWRQTKVTLGKPIGEKGNDDRLIHFAVKRMFGCLVKVQKTDKREKLEIESRKEDWRELPDPEETVLTIPQNEAILGIKEEILLKLEEEKRKEKKEGESEKLKENRKIEEEGSYSLAGLHAHLPIVCDIDNGMALFEKLVPPSEPLFIAKLLKWIADLRKQDTTPYPLALRYVMVRKSKGEGEGDLVYLKIMQLVRRNDEAINQFEKEVKKLGGLEEENKQL